MRKLGRRWRCVLAALAAIVLPMTEAVANSPMTDDYLVVKSYGDVETEVGEGVSASLDAYFSVNSGSEATVTISGLPTGVKYTAKTQTLSGKTTTRGVYYVTCSAKNKNGYTMSDIVKWTVGGASNGDYDNIGLWHDHDETAFGEMRVGEFFNDCMYMVSSVSGLPPGIIFHKGSLCSGGACTECGNFIMGMPTKPGKYKVTFTDSFRQKTVKTVIVRDKGSAYLNVAVGSGSANRGTVSGGGVKHPGTKVKLSAKPKSGYYFAGWYTDAGCTDEFWYGDSGDYRTAGESFVLDSDEPLSLYAKFVSKSEDADIWFDADDTWDVKTEYGTDDFWFDVWSQSAPKITAKGLPTGVKLSGMELVITDTSKLKPGTSLVTLTAKNLSGATATHTVRIVVPNLRSWVFDEIDYEGSYQFTVGETDLCYDPYEFFVAEGWTVTASGLPPGIKLNFNKQEGSAQLSGRATRAGIYTVTLTARKGSLTQKATFTVEVAAFPTDAVGTYGGDIGDFYDGWSEWYDISGVRGSFSMTIAKDGKISVKFPANGKTVSLSGYSCDVSEDGISVYLSDSKDNHCDLMVYPQRSLGTYQVEGTINGDAVRGQRNVAKTDAQMKTMVAKLAKIGKIQGVTQYDGTIMCPPCVIPSYYGEKVVPNITFTVGADGMVKASGKIDGRSVSGSALLQVLESYNDYLLYADFYDYKSSSGLLVYRAVFNWSWLREDNTSGVNALYEGSYYMDGGAVACKPVIYLYPEAETVCNVQLSLNGRFTCTYPDYGLDGWNSFVASPDGTLTFPDGQAYYCLYWEGETRTRWDFSHGYCVRGSETASFLADVLLKMGLTFREANEFIIYWLPLMQDNPYNVIAFQSENYTKAAKLEVEPRPDSVLRVFMAWHPSTSPVEIVAPVLEPFERKGFTVVEWGGTRVCP